MESRCDFGEYLGSPKKTQHRGRSRQSAFAESSLWRTAGIGQKRTYAPSTHKSIVRIGLFQPAQCAERFVTAARDRRSERITVARLPSENLTCIFLNIIKKRYIYNQLACIGELNF